MPVSLKWPNGGHSQAWRYLIQRWLHYIYGCLYMRAHTWLQNCIFDEQEKKNTHSWSLRAGVRELISARGRYYHIGCQVCTDLSKVLRQKDKGVNSSKSNPVEIRWIDQNSSFITLCRVSSAAGGDPHSWLSPEPLLSSFLSPPSLQPFIAWENLSTTWNMCDCRQADTFRIWCLTTAETGRSTLTCIFSYMSSLCLLISFLLSCRCFCHFSMFSRTSR